MPKLADSTYRIAICLWSGGLWIMGLSAWMLFRTLNNRALAGEVAGSLFGLIAWVGLLCAAYLLVFLLVRRHHAAFRSRVFWLVLAMLLLSLAGYFGIQPILAALKAEALPLTVMESAVRGRFGMWHGISSGLYLLQCLLAVALVWVQETGLKKGLNSAR